MFGFTKASLVPLVGFALIFDLSPGTRPLSLLYYYCHSNFLNLKTQQFKWDCIGEEENFLYPSRFGWSNTSEAD